MDRLNREGMRVDKAKPTAVALDGVTVAFDLADAQPYIAVEQARLAVADGEFVAIVGPTGCGKSTLLNVAAGLLQPSSGAVSVFGKALAGINTRAGYLFQTEALMPWRSAIDNVIAGLEFRGVPAVAARVQGERWLARVGLAGFEGRFPHQLSGGMRQRVSVAQKLI